MQAAASLSVLYFEQARTASDLVWIPDKAAQFLQELLTPVHNMGAA